MTTQTLLSRPIYGGIFGEGRFALASMPCVSRGLHSIKYMVVEPSAGTVLAVAADKVAALSGARRVLAATSDLQAANDERAPRQSDLWGPEELPLPVAAPAAPPLVSRRRREVYARSAGRCFYCSTSLALDGDWHIEHQLPRALGGGDDALNLVAACAPCNLRKADRTAVEFLARRQRPADS